MIYSEKYNFCFIKTRKVAGTSVEIALSECLSDDAIITPIKEEDEALRQQLGYRGAQNYADGTGKVLFRNHMSASLIRERLGEERWNRAFKFTIERNPFDKAVSGYFWQYRNKRAKETPSFREHILAGGAVNVADYDLYAISGLPVVDRFIRYEFLEEDLKALAAEIGLPREPAVGHIRAKGGVRKREGYREFYDEETRAVMELMFARELKLFGYRC